MRDDPKIRILDPIPDEPPEPDCDACGGEGVAQSFAHQILADERSNRECAFCWENNDE